MSPSSAQAVLPLPEELLEAPPFPERVRDYPRLRFMGSKFRLLPWLYERFSELEFDSAIDAFSGSGTVAYLLKAMGKEVTTNDFMRFPTVISRALVENSQTVVDAETVRELLVDDPDRDRFIESTFSSIFYTPEDLRFLDRVWWNLRSLDRHSKALVLAALIRSCSKRQPRGVFSVAGDPERYKDGRRDLRLGLEEHFLEQIEVMNETVFDNGRNNRALHGDVFDLDVVADLVYLDPPYIPRSDDNCYMKRYHFLEGLSCYWQGVDLMETSVVKKIEKPFTPFSYRRRAEETFDRLFRHFSDSRYLALSYSSNGFPDLDVLVRLMREAGRSVEVFEREHRYHFGTHSAAARNKVQEYLILGTASTPRTWPRSFAVISPS